MDGYLVDKHIRYGYAKCAEKVGEVFDLYRATIPINPISSGYFIGSLPATFSQDWSWMKGNSYGNAVWLCCIDAQESSYPLSAKEADYLVGSEKIYFIMSVEVQLPVQVVECNRIIEIIRPSQNVGPGFVGYIAGTKASSETVMTQIPASILLLGRGQMARSQLPTDINQPILRVLLPNIADVSIRTGDTIIDDTNQQYTIMECEMQEFGWRLSAQQVVNSR